MQSAPHLLWASWLVPAVRLFAILLTIATAPLSVAGVQRDPLPAESAGLPLTIEEVARLATTDQPLLNERQAKIIAEEKQAIAAAQLPDPKLTSGLHELPVDTAEAFSVSRDSFTEFTLGISQDFPRAEKRRLQGARKQLDADVDRAALDNEQRMVRRDAALAWLDVYESEQALKLEHQLVSESMLQVQALEKDYGAGKASQADWLAAKVDAGLAEDKEHDGVHHVARMRAALERWIGDEANRPLADLTNESGSAAPLPGLLAGIEHHPVIGELDKQIEASATQVALARQAYKPDYSVEAYVAYRRDFADFVGIQFSVGLPFFTRNRQDPELAAALQLGHASEERKRDVLRELQTQIHQDYIDRLHDEERVAQFDASIIPDAQRRIEAARSSYQSGRGSFDAVLMARRALLDVQLQRLSLTVDSARAQVRLRYWSASSKAPGEQP